MGLWDKLDSGAKYISKKMDQQNEEINKYRDRYDDYDDEKLKRIYNSSTGAKKLASGSLLRDRKNGSR